MADYIRIDDEEKFKRGLATNIERVSNGKLLVQSVGKRDSKKFSRKIEIECQDCENYFKIHLDEIILRINNDCEFKSLCPYCNHMHIKRNNSISKASEIFLNSLKIYPLNFNIKDGINITEISKNINKISKGNLEILNRETFLKNKKKNMNDITGINEYIYVYDHANKLLYSYTAIELFNLNLCLYDVDISNQVKKFKKVTNSVYTESTNRTIDRNFNIEMNISEVKFRRAIVNTIRKFKVTNIKLIMNAFNKSKEEIINLLTYRNILYDEYTRTIILNSGTISDEPPATSTYVSFQKITKFYPLNVSSINEIRMPSRVGNMYYAYKFLDKTILILLPNYKLLYAYSEDFIKRVNNGEDVDFNIQPMFNLRNQYIKDLGYENSNQYDIIRRIIT